jgi:hypothetical protein
MRQIPNYPNYCIEEDGTVWSFRHKEPKILKQSTDHDGYNTIKLRNLEGKKILRVHRLVALTYIPNPNDYPIVCHKVESIPMNNHKDNLWWGTSKQNIQDMMKKGRRGIPRNLKQKGESHPASKLTNEDVYYIRSLNFEDRFMLAAKFNVTTTCIRLIQMGKSWKHLL